MDLGIDWDGLNMFMTDLVTSLERLAVASERIADALEKQPS